MFATRVVAWGLIVTSVCFAPALAQEVTDPFGGSPASAVKPTMPDATKVTPVAWAEDRDQRTSRIQQTLRDPLDSVGIEVDQMPLHEVISLLRENYDLQVQLDLAALEDLGLTPNTPIDASLENISLGAALRLLLKPHDLTYVISDEVLLITSEEEALTRLTIGVYPVGDLFASKEGSEADDSADQRRRIGNMDALVHVIHSTVASDTWVNNGGPEADICAMQPGLLIISQTRDVHEEIQQLLAALRLAKQHEFAIPHTEDPPKEPDQGGGGMF
ncbi:hypothetical protein [Aeoliella sp. SH292]|uniref:hypothetical protein n=1 Tax=Aeoliella sp. SH292 TaxID=3454464 RepID=UPI003F94FFA8